VCRVISSFSQLTDKGYTPILHRVKHREAHAHMERHAGQNVPRCKRYVLSSVAFHKHNGHGHNSVIIIIDGARRDPGWLSEVNVGNTDAVIDRRLGARRAAALACRPHYRLIGEWHHMALGNCGDARFTVCAGSIVALK